MLGMEINKFISEYHNRYFPEFDDVENLNEFILAELDKEKNKFLNSHKFNNAKNKIRITNKHLFKYFKYLCCRPQFCNFAVFCINKTIQSNKDKSNIIKGELGMWKYVSPWEIELLMKRSKTTTE